ncbi:hypothetical protein KIPB_016150, partial [Kipferlia bialata]
SCSLQLVALIAVSDL